MRNQRSPEAAETHKLYKIARWLRIRDAQLAREPLCAMCKQQGRITTATVCDHITPHRNNRALFWSGPFQSLCAAHHSADKQTIERGGNPKPTIGIDGWPIA